MNKNLQGLKNYKSGLLAEFYAECYLRIKGYSIKERRYKTKVGEIDIIAKKSGVIIFLEVKKRKSLDDALLCITEKMKKRILDAAKIYLMKEKLNSDSSVRFDIIAVSGFKIKHIVNSFISY